MSDLHFADNYRDLSQQQGTGAGFQFEFYCQCCNDNWRSPFAPYRSGQASGWMREAGSFLGGIFGNIGGELENAADGMARAGWGTSRDEAFKQAVTSAQQHFHRCAQCHRYACDRCFNADNGLCQSCAPDLAAAVQTARHSGTLQAATDQARNAGLTLGTQTDPLQSNNLVCPQCHSETHGGRFCGQCGHDLQAASNCRGCQQALPIGSRFCPACGTPASA